MLPVYIYGSGGHGRVICEILLQQNHPVAEFVDDNVAPGQTHLHSIPLCTADQLIPQLDPTASQWIVAIGHNTIRRTLVQKLESLDHTFATVIHPTAYIGARVTLAPGTVVMANTVINCDTHLGQHVILNTSSTIDHDCHIGDFCHIAPGSTLCGHVTVAAGTWLPVGSKVAPGVEIGAGVVGDGGMARQPVHLS